MPKLSETSYVQLKNQIDLIKNTCEEKLTQIHFTPMRGVEKSELAGPHLHVADGRDETTTLASSSRNEVQPNSMSWRNKQVAP